MTFDELIADVLRREGGYVDHPADRGGATNLGVTQAVYDAWRDQRGLQRQSVRLLTSSEAASLYHARYWQAARCDDLPEPLRDIHFDAAVNHGVRRAAVLLQRAVGVTDDGLIGPATLAAAAANPALVRARYLAARYRFYGDIIQRDRSQLAFMAGWMARMEAFA